MTVYTGSDVDRMREIALNIAYSLISKHSAVRTAKNNMIAVLEYAESIAQTYIQAGVTPDEFDECYKELLRK